MLSLSFAQEAVLKAHKNETWSTCYIQEKITFAHELSPCTSRTRGFFFSGIWGKMAKWQMSLLYRAEQGSTVISTRILNMVTQVYQHPHKWMGFLIFPRSSPHFYCAFRISSGMGLVNLVLDYEFSVWRGIAFCLTTCCKGILMITEACAT